MVVDVSWRPVFRLGRSLHIHMVINRDPGKHEIGSLPYDNDIHGKRLVITAAGILAFDRLLILLYIYARPLEVRIGFPEFIDQLIHMRTLDLGQRLVLLRDRGLLGSLVHQLDQLGLAEVHLRSFHLAPGGLVPGQDIGLEESVSQVVERRAGIDLLDGVDIL